MKHYKHSIGVPYARGNGYTYFLKIRDENGKKKTWFSKTFQTYEEALQDSLTRQKLMSHIEKKPAMTDKLSDYLDKWLKQKYYYQVKPSTFAGAEANVRLHVNPYIGNKSMSSISKKDIETLISILKREGNLSNSSICFVKNTLSSAFRQAVEDNMLTSNPCSRVKLPPIPKYHRELLQKDEIDEFLELAQKHGIYLEVLFAITYGFRMGELLGLRFKDFNSRRKTVVPVQQVSRSYSNDPLSEGRPKLGYSVNSSLKTNESSGRVLNITEQTNAFLKKLREKYISDGIATKDTIDDCFIFCNPDGSFRKQNYLKKRFDKLRKEYGLPKLRFHDLRHTFASYLLEDGVPIAAVSSALGHASITTTYSSYYDIINSGKDIADRMGKIVGGADVERVNNPVKALECKI